jgi:hypothetical protein
MIRLPSLRFSLLAALLIAGSAGPVCARESDGWLTRLFCRAAFHYYLHEATPEILKEARSGESGVYYFTSYYLHGMLSAAEATGSDFVMKRAVKALDTMVAQAQTIEYKGEKFQAWGPFMIAPHSDVSKPNVHYTLQAAVPLARAAYLILSRPEWRTKYEASAQRYIAFLDSSIVRYWYLTQYRRTVPWLNTEHVPIWNDNATNMGLVATFLYRATGDPTAKEIALAVGQAFQAKLAPTGRGWIWESHTIPIGSDTDNTPGSVGNQAGVPDTSHTNREPLLVIALHEAGLMFTKDDVDRMAYTFLDTIWNQSHDNPSFANYINGSNKPYRVYKDPGLNGPIYHGWAFVGGYSPEAQKVLVSTLKAIAKGKKNPSLIRNATSYGGKLGLTGQILRNYAVLERARPDTLTKNR